MLVEPIAQTEQIPYLQVSHQLVAGLAVEIVAQVRGTVSRVDLVGAALPAAVWVGQGLLDKATMEVMQVVLLRILVLVVEVVQVKLALMEPQMLEEMAATVLHLLFLAHLLPTQVVVAEAHPVPALLVQVGLVAEVTAALPVLERRLHQIQAAGVVELIQLAEQSLDQQAALA